MTEPSAKRQRLQAVVDLLEDTITSLVKEEVQAHCTQPSLPDDAPSNVREFFRQFKKKLDGNLADTLKWAAINGRLDIVKFACERSNLTLDDSIPTVRDTKLLPSIFAHAAEDGHLAIMRYLCNRYGLTAEHARYEKNLALGLAADNGHLEVVRFLHDMGLTADDVQMDNFYPLWTAAEKGHFDVFKYITESFQVTEDHVCTSEYWLVMKEAVFHGRLDILRYLVDRYDLDRGFICHNDNQLLRLSAEQNHLDQLKYLKEHFALTANQARAVRNYALRKSALAGHVDMVDYLINHFGLTNNDLADLRIEGVMADCRSMAKEQKKGGNADGNRVKVYSMLKQLAKK